MALKLLDICLLVGTEVVDRILLGIAHRPHSLKKHWARAEGSNNLMLTVAWPGLRLPPTSEAMHAQADGWEWEERG